MSPISKNLRKKFSSYKSDTIAMDFVESELWCSLGNFAMNKLLSGSYLSGIPFHRTTVIGGQSGSGKSLILATAAACAQKQLGAFIVWLDAEKANIGQKGREWLENLGVNTEEESFLYLEVATISDVKKVVSDVVKELKSQGDSAQPVFIAVDSYSMLLTDSQFENAKSGEVVGDQGQKAKQLKDLITAITALSSRVPLAVAGVVHTMASQDKYDPDEKLTGGRGLEYAASLVVVVNKLKMKADQVEKSADLDLTGVDNKKVVGIRAKVQVYKSRFAKPHEKVFVQIPYPKGLDPYSGLFDLMQEIGEIDKPAIGWNRYRYKENGEVKEVKFREKDFRQHADEIMRLSEAGQLLIDEEVREVVKKTEESGE